MVLTEEQKKKLKVRLASEIKSYCETITPKGKWVYFERTDFDAILNDIVKSVEEEI